MKYTVTVSVWDDGAGEVAGRTIRIYPDRDAALAGAKAASVAYGSDEWVVCEVPEPVLAPAYKEFSHRVVNRFDSEVIAEVAMFEYGRG